MIGLMMILLVQAETEASRNRYSLIIKWVITISENIIKKYVL